MEQIMLATGPQQGRNASSGGNGGGKGDGSLVGCAPHRRWSACRRPPPAPRLSRFLGCGPTRRIQTWGVVVGDQEWMRLRPRILLFSSGVRYKIPNAPSNTDVGLQHLLSGHVTKNVASLWDISGMRVQAQPRKLYACLWQH